MSDVSSTIYTKKIIVKFHTGDGKVFTHSYFQYTSIGDIKTTFESIFDVAPKYIEFRRHGIILKDNLKLVEFNSGPFGILDFDVVCTNLHQCICADQFYEDLSLKDILTVNVEDEEVGVRQVVVEVEDKAIQKPFLGGYRHKETLAEYAHGYTQTGPPKPKLPVWMKSNRDTQTYFWRNRKLDTVYSQATQMTSTDTWIPTVNDRIITAGPYETAEEMEKRLDVEGKVRTIQRYFRAWKMRKGLHALHEEYQRMMRTQQELEEAFARDHLKSQMEEIVHKIFPYTKTDFLMIGAMIERWKRSEIQRISEQYCGPAKITEFYVLLQKEIEMLRAVEAHKQKVLVDMEVQMHKKNLKKISEPLVWNSYKNIRVEMHTLRTQKGKQFLDMCNNICDNSLDKSEHLQALLNIKLHLHNHNCKVYNELIDLIDRACELIARGISSKYLDGLKKRIQNLFLYHIELPECNEGVMDYIKKKKEILMEGDLFFCNQCELLKSGNEFTIDCHAKKLKVCKNCIKNDKVAEPAINLEPFRFMLNTIRKEERIKGSKSSYPYILQDKDIYYITVKIWHSHSAISESGDVYSLHLCRWFRDVDWSPWNCILLTKVEAKEHLKIKNLYAVYDEQFLCHVFNKQILAKKHFALLMKLDEMYQSPGEHDSKWNELRDLKTYVKVDHKDMPF